MQKHPTSIDDLNKVIVIGGGRWARIILLELDKLLADEIALFCVTSHFVNDMRDWGIAQNMSRKFEVLASLPKQSDHMNSIAIVANAASNHTAATSTALENGFHVLVEKPFALCQSQAMKIIELARRRGLILASAHVFMFSNAVAKFKEKISTLDNINYVKMIWTDQLDESHSSSRKIYDPSTPIYLDVFPHVFSILYQIGLTPQTGHLAVDLSRGGSCLKLKIENKTIKFDFFLERNSMSRRRFLEVQSNEKEIMKLDFVREPMRIFDGNEWQVIDTHDNEKGALSLMLEKFVEATKGISLDLRLNNEIGKKGLEWTDQIRPVYDTQQLSFIKSKINAGNAHKDPDIRYAILEIINSISRENDDVAEKKLAKLMSGKNGIGFFNKYLYARQRYFADPDS